MSSLSVRHYGLTGNHLDVQHIYYLPVRPRYDEFNNHWAIILSSIQVTFTINLIFSDLTFSYLSTAREYQLCEAGRPNSLFVMDLLLSCLILMLSACSCSKTIHTTKEDPRSSIANVILFFVLFESWRQSLFDWIAEVNPEVTSQISSTKK